MKNLLGFSFLFLCLMAMTVALIRVTEVSYLIAGIAMFAVPLTLLVAKSLYNGSLRPRNQLYNIIIGRDEKHILCEVGYEVATYPGSYTTVWLQRLDLASGNKTAEAAGTDFLGFFFRLEKGCALAEGENGYWVYSEGKSGYHLRDKITLAPTLTEHQLRLKIQSKFPKLGNIVQLKFKNGRIALADDSGIEMFLHPDTLQEISAHELALAAVQSLEADTSTNSFFYKNYTYELKGDTHKTVKRSIGKTGNNPTQLGDLKTFIDAFFLADLSKKDSVLINANPGLCCFIIHTLNPTENLAQIDCFNFDGTIKWSLPATQIRGRTDKVYGGYLLSGLLLLCHARGIVAIDVETGRVRWDRIYK